MEEFGHFRENDEKSIITFGCQDYTSQNLEYDAYNYMMIRKEDSKWQIPDSGDFSDKPPPQAVTLHESTTTLRGSIHD